MIAGIIVLYHPEADVLSELIERLQGQVDTLLVIDNTEGSMSIDIAATLGSDISVTYIPLGRNVGIGAAQNEGIRKAAELRCSHILLLDQDSAPEPGMVSRLLRSEAELLANGIQVAALGPVFIDKKTGERSCSIMYAPFRVRRIYLDSQSEAPVETANLIASGSLIRMSVLEAVGDMRGELFIDFVDTEWALRARQRGYLCYCVPDAEMAHSMGDHAIKVFGKNVYMHSDLRRYYRIRNAIYLLRVRTMGWHWQTYMAVRIPYYLLLFGALSDNKGKTIRYLGRAVLDGLLGRLGPAQRGELRRAGGN